MTDGETDGQPEDTSEHESGPDEGSDSPAANQSTSTSDDASSEPDVSGESQGKDGVRPRGKRAWFQRMGRLRKLGLPIMTLLLLGVIFMTFHSILLPFIFAVAIVYLMEPIVKRLSQRLPRWTAVILVYLTFFGVLSISILVVVPRFVEEIVRFAQTVPETITEFRKDKLPGINEDVQQFLQSYLPVDDRNKGLTPAKSAVHDAVSEASSQSLAFGAAHQAVHAGTAVEIEMQLVRREPPGEAADGDQEAAKRIEITGALDDRGPPSEQAVEYERKYRVELEAVPRLDPPTVAEHGEWVRLGRGQEPVARFVPAESGGFDLYLNEPGMRVEQVGDRAWKVDRPELEEQSRGGGLRVQSVFDLEATVNEMVEGAVSTSNERISSLIGYLQLLVVGIIHAFVSIILTFMVAAFISIDLPSFIRFFRDLLPSDYRSGYEELLGRLDKGLAGVVRGQLLICLVNGILTYIGLLILDIKFAVLLAVVAGVLSLIPIFGTILSTIPIVIIGLMDGFVTGVLALAWILGIHFIEANLLNPQIIGTSAHIHPVIVIFALLAGESAFGLVGALLAVPVASILLTLFKFVRDRFFGEEAGEVAADSG
ncbi:MAG: AI-2E family transporter [Myxococcota bacterium]